MLRNLLAGLLMGSALNMIVIQVNMLVLFPALQSIDMSDPVEFNA